MEAGIAVVRCLRWLGLAAWLLTGCGTNHYDVGPFESYVRTYRAEAVHYGRSSDIPALEMSFGKVSEELQGYCTFVPVMRFDGLVEFSLVPTVYIDSTAWEVGDEGDHEALILHELGHCLLGRSHESRMKESEAGVPRSLMYPTKLPKGVYTAHRDYYLNELFRPPPE